MLNKIRMAAPIVELRVVKNIQLRRLCRPLLGSTIIALALGGTSSILSTAKATQPASASGLDAQVTTFLQKRRGTWRDLNVPYIDGKVLFDMLVERGAKSVLEIGTSTGHSTIWLAWAVSKTGGKVITIEIDEDRYRTALENFEEAGVSDYIEAHLADAHKLVKELQGPFDFVFSDADKDWYTQYFKDVSPKLSEGGCVAAHNALNGFAGVDAFLDYVKKQPDFVTTIDRTSDSGISLSCKKGN